MGFEQHCIHSAAQRMQHPDAPHQLAVTGTRTKDLQMQLEGSNSPDNANPAPNMQHEGQHRQQSDGDA